MNKMKVINFILLISLLVSCSNEDDLYISSEAYISRELCGYAIVRHLPEENKDAFYHAELSDEFKVDGLTVNIQFKILNDSLPCGGFLSLDKIFIKSIEKVEP